MWFFPSRRLIARNAWRPSRNRTGKRVSRKNETDVARRRNQIVLYAAIASARAFCKSTKAREILAHRRDKQGGLAMGPRKPIFWRNWVVSRERFPYISGSRHSLSSSFFSTRDGEWEGVLHAFLYIFYIYVFIYSISYLEMRSISYAFIGRINKFLVPFLWLPLNLWPSDDFSSEESNIRSDWSDDTVKKRARVSYLTAKSICKNNLSKKLSRTRANDLFSNSIANYWTFYIHREKRARRADDLSPCAAMQFALQRNIHGCGLIYNSFAHLWYYIQICRYIDSHVYNRHRYRYRYS